MQKSAPRYDRSTLCARAWPQNNGEVRPLSLPIERASVYAASSAAQHADLFRSGADTFYLRFGHPSEKPLAEKIATLEGAEAAAVFASGMAAISTTLIAHLRPGDHVVTGDQIFDQTDTTFTWLAETCGVEVTRVDTQETGKVADAMKPNTRLVYIETPSNPTLRISDIAAIGKIAASVGALLIVDSTFASPFAQQPLSLGADLVVHSGTKLINGHSDAMCGLVAGRVDLIQPILAMRRLLGGVLDPSASWLVQRGLRTLKVRADAIFASARRVADTLSEWPGVRSVSYPLLSSSKNYDVAKRQMCAGGGVVCFTLDGGAPQARAFVDALEMIEIATSLGGVETTVELPYDLDWIDKPPSDPELAGLIRLSVGLESIEDITGDLKHALVSLLAPRQVA
jgi:methionine-gamma-lyase